MTDSTIKVYTVEATMEREAVNERCKDCPYFKSYYHGMRAGSIEFSYRCWWTGRDPETVKDGACRKVLCGDSSSHLMTIS